MTKTLEELLAIGIRAELEAIEAYSKLAEQIQEPFLQDRFNSLAKDEDRHRDILEGLFKENFPGKPMSLPEKSGVPKIHPIITPENTVEEILKLAMDAEKLAENYYKDLAGQFEDNEKKDLLNYLANIESGHYYFLKLEYDMVSKNLEQ